jgi:SAM-dependent methyltransferase
MSQTEIMLICEADAWLDRNREKLGMDDRVTEVIRDLKLNPERVIEVGCSNGWRLERLQKEFGCLTLGVEPGQRAVKEARARDLCVYRATADAMPIHSRWADLLIYGFCLYLTEPGDWFRIASEGDRVLKAGGHIVIHDFAGDGDLKSVPYRHRRGVFSYHFDFGRLWIGHPLYRGVTSIEFKGERITVMRKLRIEDIA